MMTIDEAGLRRKEEEKRDDLEARNPSRANAGGLMVVAKWLIAAFVLASLLFAHGCHGDEDHELFTMLIRNLR